MTEIHKDTGEIEAINETSLDIQTIQKSVLYIQNYEQKKVQHLTGGHIRNQSCLIDLTKKSIENISCVLYPTAANSSNSKMKVLDESDEQHYPNTDDKENLNPSKLRRLSGAYFTERQKNTYNEKQSENICLRIVD